MPLVYPYTQYSGIWTMQQVDSAIAAGTWPQQPANRLYTWGYNNNGQLGFGNLTNYSSPKQLNGTSVWLQVSTGYRRSFAIRSDNTLWAWGSGYQGGLGLGNTTSYSSPKQVGALTNWLKISGGNYTCIAAIKTDGTLWTWGANGSGQLGLGNTTAYSSPKQVGALTNWSMVSSGVFSMAAIKTDGTLWTWGYNNNGILGLGTTGAGTEKSSPTQVGALTNWLNVCMGQYSTLATRTDGTLWAWGANNYGELGLGNITKYSSPKQVGALTNWSQPQNAYGASGAVKTDGTLWTWGYSPYGGLGLGNTTYYSSPKQVGALANWAKLQVGYAGVQAYGLKTDGTLWAWGSNNQGQLGLGNTTWYSSPKQVGSSTNWIDIAGWRDSPVAIFKA